MRVAAEPAIRPLPRTISQLLAMRDNRSFGKMGKEFWVMATAVDWGFGASLWFVNRHPTVKMVALSFLLLIGMTPVTTGAGFQVPTGHIDAAMGFSVIVAPTLSEISDPDKKLKGWPLRQPGSHYRLVATAA
jgi:hypothetical protein